MSIKKAVSPLSRARQPANGSLISLTKNLAKDYPDMVKRLTKLHEEWAGEVKQQ
jgi:hypothetical protein